MQVNRSNVFHVLRAASEITGCKKLVVVGSAALLAGIAESRISLSLQNTQDIDVFAKDAPSAEDFAADLEIIGWGSMFHRTYDYYADGVSPNTATMPVDWESRAKEYAVPASDGATVLVPDVADLAVAKLCAWREKDREWLQDAHACGLYDIGKVGLRLENIIQAEDSPGLEERVRRFEYLKTMLKVPAASQGYDADRSSSDSCEP